METRTPENAQNTGAPANTEASRTGVDPVTGEFLAGTTVIYGLHGKCVVGSVEFRTVGGNALKFYRLDIQKSTLSRSARQEPSIWLPVQNARERGLRIPADAAAAEAAIALLNAREYYFPLNEHFHQVAPRLEACIRAEGVNGLAKVFSYLHVVRKKHIVPPQDVVRLQESVSRVLMRELSEATGELPKAIEDRIARGLRTKLAPDS